MEKLRERNSKSGGKHGDSLVCSGKQEHLCGVRSAGERLPGPDQEACDGTLSEGC